jgi:hypothetical protein
MDDELKWESFVGGVALIHAMVRLAAVVVSNAHFRLGQGASTNQEKSSMFSRFLNWWKSFLGVIFSGISWRKPFSPTSHEHLIYSWSFCLQIATSESV